jgi:hypothetical protein
MKKKILITESQWKTLKQNLYEANAHAHMVKTLKEFLDNYYERVDTYVREGGEYFDKIMIKNKIDEELMSVKSLYEYMNYKFDVNEEFIKQVIRDWVSGNINDNYQLTKNVSL